MCVCNATIKVESASGLVVIYFFFFPSFLLSLFVVVVVAAVRLLGASTRAFPDDGTVTRNGEK